MAYCGDYFAVCACVQMLNHCCTPEINTVLYVSFTSVIKECFLYFRKQSFLRSLFCKYFSQSVACLLVLLAVSSVEHMFLILAQITNSFFHGSYTFYFLFLLYCINWDFQHRVEKESFRGDTLPCSWSWLGKLCVYQSMRAVGFCRCPLSSSGSFLLIRVSQEFLIINLYWRVSNAFSASVNVIMWLFFSVLM